MRKNEQEGDQLGPSEQSNANECAYYARLLQTSASHSGPYLGIGPSGDFDNHVEHLVLLIRMKWNVVKWTDIVS